LLGNDWVVVELVKERVFNKKNKTSIDQFKEYVSTVDLAATRETMKASFSELLEGSEEIFKHHNIYNIFDLDGIGMTNLICKIINYLFFIILFFLL